MSINVIPLSVTKKVISAGSRCLSSRRAEAKPLPMVLNNAIPAMATTNSFGKEVSSPVTKAPNSPITI